jgi:hypothetical protein
VLPLTEEFDVCLVDGDEAVILLELGRLVDTELRVVELTDAFG